MVACRSAHDRGEDGHDRITVQLHKVLGSSVEVVSKRGGSDSQSVVPPTNYMS